MCGKKRVMSHVYEEVTHVSCVGRRDSWVMYGKKSLMSRLFGEVTHEWCVDTNDSWVWINNSSMEMGNSSVKRGDMNDRKYCQRLSVYCRECDITPCGNIPIYIAHGRRYYYYYSWGDRRIAWRSCETLKGHFELTCPIVTRKYDFQ